MSSVPDDLRITPWPETVWDRIANVHASGYSDVYVDAFRSRLKYALNTLHEIHRTAIAGQDSDRARAAIEAIGEIPHDCEE
jgi:hypothetical protein